MSEEPEFGEEPEFDAKKWREKFTKTYQSWDRFEQAVGIGQPALLRLRAEVLLSDEYYDRLKPAEVEELTWMASSPLLDSDTGLDYLERFDCFFEDAAA
jgi:hypothetical protein